MNAYDHQRDAYRLLSGLEDGDVSPADLPVIVEQLDPVLVHAIFSYLRAVHPASDPAASAILERVVRLTRTSAEAVRKNREGAADPVVGWFVAEHGYAGYRGRGREMIDLLVDKLES